MKIRMLVAAASALVSLALSLPARAQECEDYTRFVHPRGSAELPGTWAAPHRVGDLLYVATASFFYDPVGLHVLDVHDPDAPQLVGSLELWEGLIDVAIAGDHAYGARGAGMVLIDVADPTAPVLLGEIGTSNRIQVVVIRDGVLYAANNDRGGATELLLFDLADPTAPRLLGSLAARSWIGEIVVVGTHAYLATEYGLEVVDISDSASPQPVGVVALPGFPTDLVVRDGYAYLTSEAELNVLDVSVPTAPRLVASPRVLPFVGGVDVVGSLAVVASSGLALFDVSDPTTPRLLHHVDLQAERPNIHVEGGFAYFFDYYSMNVFDIDPPEIAVGEPFSSASGAQAMAIRGDYAYVADGAAGLRVIYMPPAGQGQLIQTNPNLGFVVDVAAVPDAVYVASRDGFSIIDVDRPTHPIPRATESVPGTLFAIDVQGSFVFLAVGGAGVTIVELDAAGLPAQTRTLDSPGSAVDIVVAGEFVYVADTWNDLVVLRFDGSGDPQIVGQLALPGFAYHVSVDGSRLFVGGPGGTHLVDVSIPTAPVLVSSTPSGAGGRTAVAGDLVYVAGGLYFSTGGNVTILDYTSPEAPRRVASLFTSGNASDVLLRDGALYVADGTGGLLKFTPQCAPTVVSTETMSFGRLKELFGPE